MQGDVKKVERRLPCLLDLLQPEGREHKRDSEMEFCVSCVAAEPIYQECKKWDENRQEDHGYKAMVAHPEENRTSEWKDHGTHRPLDHTMDTLANLRNIIQHAGDTKEQPITSTLCKASPIRRSFMENVTRTATYP